MDDKHAMHARERSRYIRGFLFALALTITAFGIGHIYGATTPRVYLAIGVLGLLQLIVQLAYFLHIDRRRDSREDLDLILFSTLVLLIIIVGTVWILGDLHIRMHMDMQM